MVSKDFTVKNSQGIHMRPASEFTNEMGKFAANICIIYNGNRIDAKSIMNLIAAGIKCGAEIRVECDGPDEQEMLNKASEMIESGFNE